MIVLRALPHLTKLDNEDVTPEEVNDAMRTGVRREEPVYEEQYQEPATSPMREVTFTFRGVVSSVSSAQNRISGYVKRITILMLSAI